MNDRDRLAADLDSLDAAWADTEAALPEGWEVIEVSKYDREEGQLLTWWEATAAFARMDYPSIVSPRTVEAATADTPAAALRALAVKLREALG